MPRLANFVITLLALALVVPIVDSVATGGLLSTSLLNLVFKAASPQTPALASTSQVHIRLHDEHELLYHVEDVPYFSPKHASLGMLSSDQLPRYSDRALITVLRIPASGPLITVQDVTSALDDALAIDDVLSPALLKTLVIVPQPLRFSTKSSSGVQIHSDVDSVLKAQYGVDRVLPHTSLLISGRGSLATASADLDSLNGPYLAVRNTYLEFMDLYPVYRLYSDIYRTFMYGIYKLLIALPPQLPGGYKALRRVDEWGYNLIPVPSRLYGDQSKPLSGQRVGVKDIYDVRGLVTSAGSRAYGELYGVVDQSAYAVSKLEDLGAIFVGKTKTASFAMGKWEGAAESLEEQYPFSARADLWQSCIQSSSGSACAMTAYDWLDSAIGSDTGGSVRFPGATAGLYGNRPSTGAISLAGVIPAFDHADTAGVLTRDPYKFVTFLKSWYEDSSLRFRSYPRQPRRLLVDPDYLKQNSSVARDLISKFIKDVSEVMDIKVETFDLKGVLDKNNFTQEAIYEIIPEFNIALQWWTWIQVGQRFLRDYGLKHGGREPPIDPTPRGRWATGRAVGSEDQHDRTVKRLQDIGKWINDEVLGEANEESCSDSIWIYDVLMGQGPIYREAALNEPDSEDQPFFSGNNLCNIAGCVDITIPIGQAPFNSSVSKIEEMRPVSVSLVARRGCDFMLLDFIELLAKASILVQHGLVKTVKTGRTAF